MKADILRRAEAMSDDEEDEEEEMKVGGGGGKIVILAYDVEDLDEAGNVKIGGDGEESEDGEDEGDEEAVPKPQTPETILELAYIRDPKLFDRDAATRRSKAREELKLQTGTSCFHLSISALFLWTCTGQ
jgi:activating signal cointegrator complex subunit 2